MDEIKIANMTALELSKHYASSMLSPVTVAEAMLTRFTMLQPRVLLKLLVRRISVGSLVIL